MQCMMHCKHGTKIVYRTCGRHLRMGNDRPCPQPHVIQKYLSEHTDFTGEIVNSDRVCLTCYKCHLVLLKDNQPMSTDSDLQSLVVSISTQGKSAHMAHDIIRIATNHMLIEVGRMLLENKATLLPAILYSSFLQHTKHLVAQGMQEPPELKMVNCRWILCEITSTNCENHALPSQDRQDLADVGLEETVHNSMELEEEEEFAEFVFAAAFDVDDVNTELLDE